VLAGAFSARLLVGAVVRWGRLAISWAVATMSLVRLLCVGSVWLLTACFHDGGPPSLVGSSGGGGTTTGSAPEPTTTGSSGEATSGGGTSSGTVLPGSSSSGSGGDSSSGGCMAAMWYGDKDQDGHGDPADVEFACTQPADHVAAGDDCDDGDAERSPTVVELCDGKDNDCDALVDEHSPQNISCQMCTLYARGASSYAFCLGLRDWDGARSECALRGGDLLVVDDAGEDDAIAGQVATIPDSIGQWFFALNDRASEGGFVWLDGLPLLYTRWAMGEPNDTNNNEDCGVFYDLGDWNDQSCAALRPFVCEAPAP